MLYAAKTRHEQARFIKQFQYWVKTIELAWGVVTERKLWVFCFWDSVKIGDVWCTRAVVWSKIGRITVVITG